MTLIGLSLIVFGWIIQLRNKKPSVLNKQFLLLYAVGAFLLTIDGVRSGEWLMSLLNLGSALAVLLVWRKQK